ncbi:MAG: hypothetical protein ABH860_04750 [bacterium]
MIKRSSILMLLVFCAISLAVFAQQIHAGQPWAPPKTFKGEAKAWTPPNAAPLPANAWAPPPTFKGEVKPWMPPKTFSKTETKPWQPPKEFKPEQPTQTPAPQPIKRPEQPMKESPMKRLIPSRLPPKIVPPPTECPDYYPPYSKQ